MTIDRCQRPRRACAGFTLAEAMLAMVILSVATAGVLLPAVSGASVQAEGLHRTLGAVLAHGLIEQVVSTPFDEIVADLDAFNYKEQLKDASEDIFRDPMYANYSRELTCTWDPDQDFFILVKVRVFHSGQELVRVNRLISK